MTLVYTGHGYSILWGGNFRLFLPIYLASLLVSAGILGSFGQRYLAAQGFVPNLDTGVAVTLAIAAAYTGLQLAHMALVRLITPAKSQASLLGEAVAHATALVLVPHLIGFEIPWPKELLFKLEPFIYLGAFVGLHTVFKFVAFFIALQGEQGSRLTSLLWAGAAYACFAFSAHTVNEWRQVLDATRLASASEAAPHRADRAYALARPIREGARLEVKLRPDGKQDAVLMWAIPEAAGDLPESVFVTLTPLGEGEVIHREVRLVTEGWAEVRLHAHEFPEGVERWEVAWTGEEEPEWMVRSGFRPISRSDRTLLLAGPQLQVAEASRANPSVILILVDGLAMAHAESAGYPRATMPNLESWGESGIVYRYAFTNAPETPAATMSVFTGRDPLAHGYLGNFEGPLPDSVKTLPELFRQEGYRCGAFTEGEPPAGTRPYQQDLAYDSPFSRGFDLFDAAFPLATYAEPGSNRPPNPVYGGAEQTLTRAALWIAEQGEARHFTFVRLRELEHLLPLPRYGTVRTNDPVDIYDQALLHLDRVLAGFIERVEQFPGGENTAIVLTSSYGYDFSGGAGRAGERNLSEQGVWVPLFLHLPGEAARTRRSLVSLDDLGPALLNLASTAFPHPTTGVNLMQYTSDRERISMWGSPLSLSLRTKRWRFTWYSGRTPFTNEVQTTDQVIEMTNIERLHYGRAQEDYLRTEPALVADYKNRLKDYMLREDSPEASGRVSLEASATP